ncbi:MAG: hypothetical protein A2750_00075 [Candidatus Yanofskybacteria bacterium RIFCSPHIGHO2_01_FULL_45_42]|uniref:Uncharacterized protein n=3 Tax=Candidatus Yanofskyibacteriota TaxID=1752733 RepID=A0A1F8H411_9BACT|nr:MAG: hypothetical protein A2750_00075 [Candidatus Yanofskybacteria bacterium RIFCSPHIGHO2_01_FULL_45_42]OGN15881.1 MAG: hypothetical protein A3C81_02170 [Candidatus Yanofskybacteria bacterium RIFCSPHIGHO2_02_FULL_46_19]OGN27459.1 MAG: hypothetical protein A3B17_01625 [Candidatus Yanofskybacteria bacterium RIFCSPLOWO2_01_FULL_45_72]OGN32321.1 MAG: hypothetical protein A3J01_02535 [Candidatus Yanofskybacteria bacterium RIFCSPLOWO2_02_FULL_45_18]
MTIIKEPITRFHLRQIAQERFGDLVKVAVDIEQEIMALGGELHIDEEVFLIEEAGSKGENVWGINLYPDEKGENFIEFDSMINIKPNFGNRTRGVDNNKIKNKITDIVNKLIK